MMEDKGGGGRRMEQHEGDMQQSIRKQEKCRAARRFVEQQKTGDA